jgi:uncharacterized protein with GYD domain
MPRYISLLEFTEQGVKAIKKSTTRAHDFNAIAGKAGVKVEGEYWTVGRFDGVLILNGPEQSVLRALAELASLGNVRTQTLQAFTDQEFEAIVGK